MGCRRPVEQLEEFGPGLRSFDAEHENLSLYREDLRLLRRQEKFLEP